LHTKHAGTEGSSPNGAQHNEQIAAKIHLANEGQCLLWGSVLLALRARTSQHLIAMLFVSVEDKQTSASGGMWSRGRQPGCGRWELMVPVSAGQHRPKVKLQLHHAGSISAYVNRLPLHYSSCSPISELPPPAYGPLIQEACHIQTSLTGVQVMLPRVGPGM
jgi:hypothetical protein